MRKTEPVSKLPFPLKAKIYRLEVDKKWLEIITVRKFSKEIFGVKNPSQSQIVSTRNMLTESKRFLPPGWYLKTRIGGKRNVYYLVHPEKYKKETGHSFDIDVHIDVNPN